MKYMEVENVTMPAVMRQPTAFWWWVTGRQRVERWERRERCTPAPLGFVCGGTLTSERSAVSLTTGDLVPVSTWFRRRRVGMHERRWEGSGGGGS